MSTGPFRLSLSAAQDLADKIADTLRPVCARLEIAGSVRRLRPDAGDIEIVAIPLLSPSLLPDVPGVSLLDLELVALMKAGRLRRAWRSDTPLEELTCKDFYIPALYDKGILFKAQINVSDVERWPVELAIKTGSAAFSHKLVKHHPDGFLPKDWRIADGWRVYQWTEAGEQTVKFESEREFIEAVCGAWVPPELRN